MKCFKQTKMLCDRNIEKWGLGWWETSAQVNINANSERGSGGREKESPQRVSVSFSSYRSGLGGLFLVSFTILLWIFRRYILNMKFNSPGDYFASIKDPEAGSLI